MPKKKRAGSRFRDPFRELSISDAEMGLTTGGETVNQDLLNNLDRQTAVSPVGDNLERSSTAEVESLLSNLNRDLPSRNIDVEASDIFTQRSPITQQGYSGQTFSMPTIAAEGFTFPYHILSKKAKERRDQEAAAAKEDVSYNYDIAEISDQVRNDIFINKQKQHYDNILDKFTDQFGSRKQAIKYIKDNNIIKVAGAKWKNLQGLYDKTFANYLKVVQDSDAIGRSRFDPQTKQLAKEFEIFISDIDNFDPDQLDEYAKFYNNFNEHVSISELAKQASTDMEGINPQNIDEAADFVWGMYGDDDFTLEQKDLFMNSLKYYYKNEIADFETKENIKNLNLIGLENLRQEGRVELKELDQESALQLIERKEATEGGKPTISDQTISVTDPNTGNPINIESKNVITFPDRTFPVVPGTKIYQEGQGWVSINEVVEMTPIRQFTTNISADTPEKTKAVSILNNNSKKNFVKRILDPEKYPELDLGGGKRGSHLMSYSESDGKYFVYPTIVQKKEGGKLQKLDDKKAFDYAVKTGEFIEFDKEKDAKWFSSDDGYKTIWKKGDFFTSDKGKSQTYIQAEINAPGYYRRKGDVTQDVVNVTTADGKKLQLGGKRTVLIPLENVRDKFINEFGKNYDAIKATEEKPKEKITVSVAKYNEKKKTNLTKEQLTDGLDPEVYIVID